MKIINNNPYRLLGVYTTSPQRDIVANQGRMKAFLKVGRQVSFPLDLNGNLPEPARTELSVADATSKLTLPKDQLKYAQFWFAKCTPMDDIAFGKLTSGDFDGAVEIWKKKANASSLQNLIVCSLIKGRLSDAIGYAQKLYSSYGNEFVKMVLGENALATSDNLAHDFLNVLCEEFKPNQFISTITNAEWKEYVDGKCIQPLIDKISTAIEASKSSKGKGATVRLNAGTKLMNDTKSDLAQLKQYVAASDLKYQMIADKLGLEILQCGIDYYNDSEEPNAARKAMVLQNYAQSVVVGKMAKDRCKENVDILNNIIANLPPSEVFVEDRAIKEELRKFCNLPDKICHSVTLLNNTKTHLQKIKNKLGASNSYYLKVSTQVVGNALHNVIEEVNALQNDIDFQIEIKYNRASALSRLQSVLRSAWNATLIMDTFDMERDYKISRYNQNRRALADMCGQLGVSTSGPTGSTGSLGGGSNGGSSGGSCGGSSGGSSSGDGCVRGTIYAVIGAVMGYAFAGGEIWGAIAGGIVGLFIGISISD